MALSPQALGKLFGKLNRGEKTLSNLTSPQIAEVNNAREVFRRGGFDKNTQAYQFFTREADDYAKNAEEVIKRREQQEVLRQEKSAQQEAIRERVMGNIESQRAIRETREEIMAHNENIRQQEIKNRVLQNIEKSRSIRQSRELDNIYNNAGDVVESLGFNRNEVNQAIHSIKGERHNVYNLSDADLKDMIQDRVYEIRANNRLNQEIGPRQRERLGDRGTHRMRQQYIEEERGRTQGQQQSSMPDGVDTPDPGEGTSGNWNPSSVVDRYMAKRHGMLVNDLESAIASGQRLDADAIQAYAKQFRLDTSEGIGKDFVDMMSSGRSDSAIELMRGNAKQYAGTANLMDKAVAHKIPQKGAVVVGGAWLVNNMSASRGQQSNAQLYGQQTPYM